MGSITLTPGAAPGSPAEGEIYYDSTADKLKVRNASAFESIASGAGTIIQMVTNVVSINHAHSSTTKTRVTNGPYVVVTTKQANSKIYLLCDTQTYHYSTRTDFFRSGVGSDTSNLSGNTNGLTGPTGGDTGWENRFYHWVDAPAQPAGTAITYDAVVFGTGGTAINWGSTSYQQRITAFEIAV